jgi:hypothetical protein
MSSFPNNLLQQYKPYQLDMIQRAFFLGVMSRVKKSLTPDLRNEELVSFSNFTYENPLCQQLIEHGVEVKFSSD